MNYLLRQKIFRPPVARDAYVAHTTERTFPGGEWVEVQPEGEAEVAEAPGRDPEGSGFESRTPLSTALTIIGSTKTPEDVAQFVLEHSPSSVILGRLPSGRGAESDIAKLLKQLDVNVHEVEHDPDLFGKTDVNVEQVMSYDLTSPVLLVGSGTRVKQARSFLDRANWRREVIEL